ncbi:MAG: zinc ribbon domain-containing protein [Clostridium sp.]|nr:zinc ribbon domain-containing protein [Clostridium sp.]MCM1171536.1 zinc ribbon domain-containing protein [Clostridium sp.]MCM1209502.1 zinc ribbon domain-containing protein [Ruminococcus sp.]
MYCTQCGNNVPDGAANCNVCGAPINQGMGGNWNQQPQQPNQYQQPQQTYHPNQYQQPNGQWNNLQQSTYTQNNGSVLGMNWFKFVIYVQLFLNGVLNIYHGIKISTGKQYGVSDSYLQMIYSVYDGLQTTDIIIGVSMMALGVYAIITRFFLAGFKKQGPFMYYLCLLLNIVVAVIYCVLVKFVVGVDVVLTNMICQTIILIVLLICNIIYFGKRKHLFVK